MNDLRWLWTFFLFPCASREKQNKKKLPWKLKAKNKTHKMSMAWNWFGNGSGPVVRGSGGRLFRVTSAECRRRAVAYGPCRWGTFGRVSSRRQGAFPFGQVQGGGLLLAVLFDFGVQLQCTIGWVEMGWGVRGRGRFFFCFDTWDRFVKEGENVQMWARWYCLIKWSCWYGKFWREFWVGK